MLKKLIILFREFVLDHVVIDPEVKDTRTEEEKAKSKMVCDFINDELIAKQKREEK